jgi:hypothetical protein
MKKSTFQKPDATYPHGFKIMEQFINDERIKNTWEIIKIENLPDNAPVLVVTQYPFKDIATFHLAEYCIIPKGYLQTIETEKVVDQNGDLRTNAKP